MGDICSCGSGMASDPCRDERGRGVGACEVCKPDLLRRIFEDRYLDIFEGWMGSLFDDPPPLGYEWQWQDLLKEKGCEQVVGVGEAKRRLGPGHVMIACPNGDSLSPERLRSEDRSVYILVPREYADRVLSEGRMV